jgi:hypothetical protein
MDLRLQFPNEISLVRYSHIQREGLYFSGEACVSYKLRGFALFLLWKVPRSETGLINGYPERVSMFLLSPWRAMLRQYV